MAPRTANTHADGHPPRGRRKALRRNGRIWVAITSAVILLAGPQSLARATFPGINGRVAATNPSNIDTPYPRSEISTYQLSGDDLATGQTPLPLSSLGGDAADPAWSPDGAQLAFVRWVNRQADIWIAQADGGDAHAVITGPANDTDPTWSADGSLAFTSTRGGDSELYVANADGTGQRQLTNTDGINQQPDWSPVAGGAIAFESTRDGNHEIYLIEPDGSGETRVTNDPGSDQDVSWSPDGTKLAFATNRGLVVSSPSGTDRRRLTRDFVDGFPAWSPDGRKIVFTRLASLYVIDAARKDPHRVPASGFFDPAWAPLPPAPDPSTGAVPVLAKTAFVRPLGSVEIKVTGSDLVNQLPAGGLEIPTGSTIDASARGSAITLATATENQRRTTTMTASEGRFRFSQTRSSLTSLRVLGARCRRAARTIHRGRLRLDVRTRGSRAAARASGAAHDARKKKKKKKKGTGVKGNYSDSFSRFTAWTTIDRCKSTTTIVHRGAVEVHDRVTHKTVIVRAGHRYVARKRRGR